MQSAYVLPLLTERRRPLLQSGFTTGRSTMHATLVLRLLSESYRKFDKSLLFAYVDVKSAFDCVDRNATRRLALNGVGIPDIILDLILDLHAGTGTRVWIGSNLSPRFGTTSGSVVM